MAKVQHRNRKLDFSFKFSRKDLELWYKDLCHKAPMLNIFLYILVKFVNVY